MSQFKYKYVVIDTETTGLKNPGVLQFAAMMLNEDKKPVAYYNKFYLNDRIIDPEAEAVNGLSEDFLIGCADKYFTDDIEFICNTIFDESEFIVCYNSGYDIEKVINPTLKFVGMPQIEKNKTICAMLLSAPVLKMESKNSNFEFKNPKLTEAVDLFSQRGKFSKSRMDTEYREHFGVEIEEHDALSDVFKTVKVFECLEV